MPYNIALSAENFGFGPVSKVCSVASKLNQSGTYKFTAFGEGIVQEYFAEEGYEVMHSSTIVKYFDAAVVGISPSIANNFAKNSVPVFYIDSLAFMWDRSYFDKLEDIGIASYLCQDVFGAADNTRALAPQVPLHPVGAIIKSNTLPSADDRRIDDHHPRGTVYPTNNDQAISTYTPNGLKNAKAVISLGGFYNPFDPYLLRDYIELIRPIIIFLQRKICIGALLSSNTAKNIVIGQLPVQFVHNIEATRKFKEADAVVISPGLTTLLELSFLQKPVLLLPPQNMSQLCIIENIARMSDCSMFIHELCDQYRHQTFCNEEEGVKYVSARNRQLCGNGGLINIYERAINNIWESAQPFDLASSYEGAAECSEEITKWLVTR